jgi:hypothetical protein
MRRVGGQQNFDLLAKRRKEIVLHALHVGAMDTEDRSRWLIAWVWHNRKATDQIWSVMEAAKRMGGQICEAEAAAITEDASITRKHLSADNLARFLGVTYEQRQALHLTTIGSVDVDKRARKERRKHRNRIAKERKRRASGVRARAEYLANSLSTAQPWRGKGMSRRTWYRQNKARRRRGTSVSAPSFLSGVDRPVPRGERKEEFDCRNTRLSAAVFPDDRVAPGGEKKKGIRAARCAPLAGRDAPKEGRKEGRGFPSSQTATTMAVDRLESLPVELRLMALCLPMPENLARAA